MKKVTKILLISLSVFFFCASYAHAQLSIQAGYAYSPSKGNLELGDHSEYSGTFRNSGFQAGLNYDFKIKGDLGLQVGALYSFFRGSTLEAEKTIYGITGNLTTNSSYQFLDIPLRVTYALPVTNEFKIVLFGGPNFTYALSGWSQGTIYGDYLRVMPKYDNVYDKFSNSINRFDLKLGIGVGVQYNQIGVKVGYDFGILNSYNGLTTANSDGDKYKMRRGQLNVAVYFQLWK